MSGCDNCGAKAGCSHRKQAMFSEIDSAMARIYPTQTWGQRDFSLELESQFDDEALQGLSEILATALDAKTVVQPGNDSEYCSYIYVMCMGRPPCLAEARAAGTAIPGSDESVNELYLRVCVSHLVPFVAVQESSMTISGTDGGLFVRESILGGVYSAPLLPRFRKLISILEKEGLIHLDCGEIDKPPKGFSPGDYGELFEGDPVTMNFLFFPQPMSASVVTQMAVAKRSA